jgi:acetyl-CoA synthetase
MADRDDPSARIADWLARYGGDSVDLGAELCDGTAAADPGRRALLLETTAGAGELSFGQLSEDSRRFAGALSTAGVGAGDRVAVLLPKSTELLVALVGIWRLGAVNVPLFTAFGPDAVAYRLRHGGCRAVVTDAANREKVDPADVDRVFQVGGSTRSGDLDFDTAISRSAPFEGRPVRGTDQLMVLYTSGTTGDPKGVEIPVRALASFRSYMHYSLDVRPEDVYWDMADPGWGYGLWFAVVGPLLLGRPTMLRNVPFSAADVLDAIVRRGVTNFTASPTVYRAIRHAGVPADFRARSCLRALSSAGEPLDAELLDWSRRELGVPIHDHYGQSELGMAVGHHHHPAVASTPRPGSMGPASPGYRVVVLDPSGAEAPPGAEGDLAVEVAGSPLYWFRGYYRSPDRTAERFAAGPGYYLTGDRARLEPDGQFCFASRADDVITSSGYRVGPFEVEQALAGHPAVAESAVVGTPDPLRGEAITAFVVLTDAAAPSDALVEELQTLVKTRLAAHLYPRRVVFCSALPRTLSGKVQRAVLRKEWHEATGQVRR